VGLNDEGSDMNILENLRFRVNPSKCSDAIRDQPVKSDLLLFLAITLIGSLCYLTAYIVKKGMIEHIRPDPDLPGHFPQVHADLSYGR
jgi:hypothetical protein